MPNTVKQGVSGQTIENLGSYQVVEGLKIWNGTEFVSVATIEDIANALSSTPGGSISPLDDPNPTGNTFYFATAAGTYANAGGVVVDANSFAVISYVLAIDTWSISQTPIDLSKYATLEALDKHDPLEVLIRYEHPRGLTEQAGNGTFNSASFGGWGVSAIMDQTGVVNKIEFPFFGVADTEVEIRVYKQTSVDVLGTQLYAKVYAAGELNQTTAPSLLDVDIEVTAGDIIGVVMGWKAGSQPRFRYWNAQSGVAPLRNKMIQASTLVYPNMFTNSWSLSSGSVYQAAIKVYYVPTAIQSVNTLIEDTGLLELVEMQREVIAQDDFTTPGGFISNPSFPLTPTFMGGAMQLAFTAGTNQGVLFNNVVLTAGQKIEISIDLRRTAGSGGGLDIGNFGSANNTTEDKPYRSLLAAEISSTYKTFIFKITPTGTTFGIGLNIGKNFGNTFEIDNIVIKAGSFITEAANDIEALKSSTGVISAGATTAELQAFINANQYTKLGAGTFTITAPITVPNGHILEGLGAGTVLKLSSGNTGNIIEQIATRDWAIKNISFEGLAAISVGTATRSDILSKPGIGTNNGIYVAGDTTDFIIEGCRFKNFSLAGMNVYNIHGTNIYSRRGYIANCVVEASYHGMFGGTRSEYVSLVSNSFCNNRYGGFFQGGNDFGTSNQFNGNACNVVISGTAGQNDSHGSLIGGCMNHAVSFNLYMIDINNSFIISGVNMFASGIVLDNCKGAMIQNCIVAGTGINIINENASYNLIQNNMFVPGASVTGTTTKVAMYGNRYQDGSDSTSLNNNV